MHDLDTANQMLINLMQDVEPLGDMLKQDPQTKTTGTKSRASHLQRIKHLFHVFSGATAPRAKEGAAATAKKRWNDFDRYPKMQLATMQPAWHAHRNEHSSPDALEHYLQSQVTGANLQQYVFGPEDRDVQVKLTNTYHPIPHQRNTKVDLYPICPINPHTFEEPTTPDLFYRCHLAVTNIPFLVVVGSHTTEFLQPLDNILRKFATDEQMANADAGFQLPFATHADGVDPLGLFKKQIAIKVPRGHLVVCHPALSYVPLEHTCTIKSEEPQWACSFLLSRVAPEDAPTEVDEAPTEVDEAGTEGTGVDEAGSMTGVDGAMTEGATTEEFSTASERDDPPPPKKAEPRPKTKKTHAKPEIDYTELAARKTHRKLTRPEQQTYHLSQPTIPAISPEQRGALRARIQDTEHALRDAVSENERGALTMQLHVLKKLLETHDAAHP
jgi:hypothetical protein